MRYDIEKQLRSQLIGIQLGVSRFFEPTETFLTYMKALDAPIYDVGAGAGHVTLALATAGLKCAAIDMCEHAKQVTTVHMADGTDFPYSAGCVVMLCRPCHGGFAEQVIEQAVKCGAGMVLYVGLERNVEDDLGDLVSRFKKVAEGVGESDEAIWRMDIAERLHQRLGVAGTTTGSPRKARSAGA